jgi:hypothetical protein
VTPYDRIAIRLAGHFPEIEAVVLARARAFCDATDAALAYIDGDEIVRRVLTAGPLTGAVKPYGALIDRIRKIPEQLAHGARLADMSEELRWPEFESAATFGEKLAALVESGALFDDEALKQITQNYDDPRLADIARDAFEGHRP